MQKTKAQTYPRQENSVDSLNQIRLILEEHLIKGFTFEPRCEKTGLWGFRSVLPQKMARGLKFRI